MALSALRFALCAALCSSASACAPAAQPTAALGVNEVSILFPLPRGGAEVGLLPLPYSAGARGELLPRPLYDRLPLLLMFGGPNAIYGSLRVVAIRLDPCFPGLGRDGPAPCRSQVRVVFQPITSGFDASPVSSTDDAAVHVFYEVDRDELDQMRDELSRLKAAHGLRSDDARLGPHPIIVRQGLDGPFASAVRALLLRYVGAQNLRRVTFMTLEQFRLRWMFGGFDVAADQSVTALQIPATGGATRQVFTNFDTTGASFDHAEAAPASASSDELTAFFQSSTLVAANADAQRAAYRRALAIENPERHSPETVDCASCHVAAAARQWAERALSLRPELESASHFADGSAFASVDEPRFSTIALRAFGYVGRTPTISRRTVNESVLVVRALSSTPDR
jgi:hypothetical protein